MITDGVGKITYDGLCGENMIQARLFGVVGSLRMAEPDRIGTWILYGEPSGDDTSQGSGT
jgi:hypothetical protein